MMQSTTSILARRWRYLAAAACITLAALGMHSYAEKPLAVVDPAVVKLFPGQTTVVEVSRPGERGGQLSLEIVSLDPEVAEVPELVVVPADAEHAEIPVHALKPGTTKVLVGGEDDVSAEFTVNVLDKLEIVGSEVRPEAIQLRLRAGESATIPVEVLLSPDAIPNAVDVVFAVENRSGFAGTADALAFASEEIIARLKEALPDVSFAFSVTKFQDYGGPGSIFRRRVVPGSGAEDIRPFVLLLPTMRADSRESILEIEEALSTPLPGSTEPGIYGSYLEALAQISLGLGFDGNGNGLKTDSGLAGVPGGEDEAGFLMPGASGDVPPFGSRPEALVSAGSLGGVGFRTGSQRIVVLATNGYTVAPFIRANPFPTTVTGADGVAIPTFFFQEVFSYPPTGTFQNLRFGPRSALFDASDPINAVAPPGAATVPEVFDDLADQNVKVVSFFRISEASPLGGLIDPRPLLAVISRMTGALDEIGNPLVFELIGANAADVSEQIIDGILPVVTQERKILLEAVGNDEGFGFSAVPASVTVEPGDTAEFEATITGTGGSGAFEIHFVTEDGVIVGRIPVTINALAPQITDLDPDAGPIGTEVAITGSDFSSAVSDLTVIFGNIQSQVLAASQTLISSLVPVGSVAGIVDVSVDFSGLASNALPFTVLHTIHTFTPLSGPAGTQFTIQGSAFSPSIDGNSVNFGAAAAPIEESTNTLIRGRAPFGLPAGPYDVSVTTNEVTTEVGVFHLLPFIEEIVPGSGAGDSPVTVNGSGFADPPSANVLVFVDKLTGSTAESAVTAGSLTVLQGKVPPALTAGPHSVHVTSNSLASNEVDFTVLPFITRVVPAEATIGEQIQILGTGFSTSLSENAVTLNGRAVNVEPGSTAERLLVTVAPGTAGTTLEIQVTVRGATSNEFQIGLNQAPVILEQSIGGVTYPGVRAVFERRDRIVITVSGADPNGDVASVDVVIRDGEGQVLGRFQGLDIRSVAGSRTQFVFAVPLSSANFFTAAMQATVQLKDAAGLSSNLWTAAVINPDLRAAAASSRSARNISVVTGEFK